MHNAVFYATLLYLLAALVCLLELHVVFLKKFARLNVWFAKVVLLDAALALAGLFLLVAIRLARLAIRKKTGSRYFSRTQQQMYKSSQRLCLLLAALVAAIGLAVNQFKCWFRVAFLYLLQLQVLAAAFALFKLSEKLASHWLQFVL